MKILTADTERVCSVLFRKWCAEELVDPRLEEILEEAFINGFLARDSLEYEQAVFSQTVAVGA